MNNITQAVGSPPPFRSTAAWTLVELMVAAALMGLIFIGVSGVVRDLMRHMRIQVAQLEIERDRRLCVDLIAKRLRQGKASTVVLDRLNVNQPVLSRLSFVMVTGSTVTVWQDGRNLLFSQGAGPSRTISTRLHSLNFCYPDPNDPATLQAAVSLAQEVYWQRSKTTNYILEPIHMMND